MPTIKKLTEEQYLRAVQNKAKVRAVESEEYFAARKLEEGEALEITCDSNTEFKKMIVRCTSIKNALKKDGIILRVVQDSANNILFIKRERNE